MPKQIYWSSNFPFGIADIENESHLKYKIGCENSFLAEDSIHCCIAECNNWLVRVRRGTNDANSFCKTHGIRLSTRPTYIYDDKFRNIIIAHDLYSSAINKKVENWRLGNENSEDAVTWNVFVSFMKARMLDYLFETIVGEPPSEYPKLYLWGSQISEEGVFEFAELSRIRSDLEKGLSIPTEPDIAIVVPGQAAVLIEAKFGSKNPTLEGKEERRGDIHEFLDRYYCSPDLPDPLKRSWLIDLPSSQIYEQLCRNAIFASWIASFTGGKKAILINLVRSEDELDIEARLSRNINQDGIIFKRITWEELYKLAINYRSLLNPLGDNMKNKSYCLQKALKI